MVAKAIAPKCEIIIVFSPTMGSGWLCVGSQGQPRDTLTRVAEQEAG